MQRPERKAGAQVQVSYASFNSCRDLRDRLHPPAISLVAWLKMFLCSAITFQGLLNLLGRGAFILKWPTGSAQQAFLRAGANEIHCETTKPTTSCPGHISRSLKNVFIGDCTLKTSLGFKQMDHGQVLEQSSTPSKVQPQPSRKQASLAWEIGCNDF